MDFDQNASPAASPTYTLRQFILCLIKGLPGAVIAAIDTISGAVRVLGRRSIVDAPTFVLAAGTAFNKFPVPRPMLCAAALGLPAFPVTRF